MTPQELQAHKLAPKVLRVLPEFKPLKKGKLPKPFSRMGGGRISATGVLSVAHRYAAVFMMKDGQNFTDTHFYGHLMHRRDEGDLMPLFEFHWHPSHKGFHCKMPCRTSQDYTNRLLPGAPELAMKTSMLDPRNEADRLQLVGVFCRACGIELANGDDPTQLDIWNSRPT